MCVCVEISGQLAGIGLPTNHEGLPTNHEGPKDELRSSGLVADAFLYPLSHVTGSGYFI